MVFFILLWNGDIPVICRRCSVDVLVVDRNFKSQFMKVPAIHVQTVEKQKGLGWKIQLFQIWHLLLVTFKSWLILSSFFFSLTYLSGTATWSHHVCISGRENTVCFFLYFMENNTRLLHTAWTLLFTYHFQLDLFDLWVIVRHCC